MEEGDALQSASRFHSMKCQMRYSNDPLIHNPVPFSPSATVVDQDCVRSDKWVKPTAGSGDGI